ncbi:hypothetical protein PGQ11_008066 [Apiospora arundinis]|uniref:Uncharacterized protein n=1 Tax=Apiospora arundinis TaxID=335852 RepID=A0ABR2IEQ3_9PEZI
MSRENVESYMKTTSGGGDLATAISNPHAPFKSISDRQTSVQLKTDALLAIINKTP